MVLEGDFEVHLVYANTKLPFKEHYRDGKHYVEVEPDINYYLSYQRVWTDIKEDFILKFMVDGKDLGWADAYTKTPKRDETSTFLGARKEVTINKTHSTQNVSLKFVKKAVLCDDASDNEKDDDKVDDCYNVKEQRQEQRKQYITSVPIIMGKVEFKLYKAHETPQLYTKESLEEFLQYSSNGEDSLEDTREDAADTKAKRSRKEVKSQKGNLIETRKEIYMRYYPGKIIQTITLHYCTVPGLIDVGVLPKPKNIYEHYKLVTGQQNLVIPPPLVPPQRMQLENTALLTNGEKLAAKTSYCDYFDLTLLDDSSLDEPKDKLVSITDDDDKHKDLAAPDDVLSGNIKEQGKSPNTIYTTSPKNTSDNGGATSSIHIPKRARIAKRLPTQEGGTTKNTDNKSTKNDKDVAKAAPATPGESEKDK